MGEKERGGLGKRVKAVKRDQMVMRVVDVENLIDEDHPARSVWEFVGRQNLEAFYSQIKTTEGGLGRSPWDPRMMIALWVYAYSDGVNSARDIEKLCNCDPAYQWITGNEVVNHHSLSDFRVEHGEALKKLFVEILGALSSEGLIKMRRVMHDGTKIEANASGKSFRRKARLEEYLKDAEEQVKAMEESEEGTSDRVRQAKRRAARERKERLERALKELEEVRTTKSGEKEKEKARASMSDPEARIMKQNNGGYGPSYNVQITTDSNEKLIVGVKISQSSSDFLELKESIDLAVENTGRTPEQVVVDGGYVSSANIMKFEKKGIELIGPLPDNRARTAGLARIKPFDPEFLPEKFSYDPDRDAYTCPLGKILKYVGKQVDRGDMRYLYKGDPSVCGVCPKKRQCCMQNKTGVRVISRKERLPIMVKFEERMATEEAQKIYKQRSAVAEFPHLWIKEKFRARKFRLRGLAKVRLEAIWLCLSYNIIQWIRLSSRPHHSPVS